MEILEVLLVVYSAVLLMNSLFSGFLLYIYRERFFQLTFYLWLTSFFNFFLQGVFSDLDIYMVIAFSTYFPCSMILATMLAESSQQSLPKELFYILQAFALIGAISAHLLGLGFFSMAMGPALALAFPMMYASIKSIWNQSGPNRLLRNLFAFLIFTNALHFIDYPFFRWNPDYAVIGFSLALIFLISFSILIPFFNIKHLTDRNLANAYKALEVKNLRLGDLIQQNRMLLSIVCHDIATPLSIINFLAFDLLGKKLANEDPSIYNKLQRAILSINGILEQARLCQAVENNKIALKIEKIFLSKIFEEISQDFSQKLDEKNIKIKFENRLDVDEMKSSSEILRLQILSNIISNAIKFSYPHGEIYVSSFLDSENRVVIKIRDEGVGIPPEKIDSIFSEFSPTSTIGTSGEKGTGLGLNIVKSFTELLSGTVSLESVHESQNPERSGTCFTLVFPREIQKTDFSSEESESFFNVS